MLLGRVGSRRHYVWAVRHPSVIVRFVAQWFTRMRCAASPGLTRDRSHHGAARERGERIDDRPHDPEPAPRGAVESQPPPPGDQDAPPPVGDDRQRPRELGDARASEPGEVLGRACRTAGGGRPEETEHDFGVGPLAKEDPGAVVIECLRETPSAVGGWHALAAMARRDELRDPRNGSQHAREARVEEIGLPDRVVHRGRRRVDAELLHRSRVVPWEHRVDQSAWSRPGHGTNLQDRRAPAIGAEASWRSVLRRSHAECDAQREHERAAATAPRSRHARWSA